MGRQLKALTSALIDFINNQKLFFVATAMEDGTVNLSPKGLDSLRVINENRVIWLNMTGSGNETAIHLSHKNRITLMFCAFEGNPLILRLYGKASVCNYNDSEWTKHIDLFPTTPGARQLIDVQIEKIQTSCGMGVPLIEYKEDRRELLAWAEDKGIDGLEKYWEIKNTNSIDGFQVNSEIK
ncbi:pyridoxamine 5'-phosphate oxidase family protein [Muricauda sp. JGD-17]|uniref:Pyridoxamine 5'-phosphate oxidase family protein n=1 Tax=Flagellimonas ochracea TaxID=2696472 RepID=A0A964TF99_9FLAO|nr:pyridoxamine 5'-phosphate oxidase family protein [Allomuricauda ochracea]NAY93276.1 pyridoxamine 5'-phosphate oxidase family protein [Allomuricauda ochracea]